MDCQSQTGLLLTIGVYLVLFIVLFLRHSATVVFIYYLYENLNFVDDSCHYDDYGLS